MGKTIWTKSLYFQ